MGLLVTYPLMKRVTYWPQLFLGGFITLTQYNHIQPFGSTTLWFVLDALLISVMNMHYYDTNYLHSCKLSILVLFIFITNILNLKELKKKVWFYIALYPVHWTAQSALHFPPLADLFIPTPFSASLGSILAFHNFS